MTEEQFNRAIKIHNRLVDLRGVKKEIESMESNRLSYLYRTCSDGYNPCQEYRMRHIAEILDKHDKMIREEIDEEIRKLQEEVKEL